MPTKDISVIAAQRIAAEAHEGQTDRGGTPYIKHAETVAETALDIALSELPLLRSDDRILVVIEALGLLHDVIEDAPSNAQRVDRLRRITLQCGKDIADGVVILTRDPLESYVEYIGQVAEAPYAVRVVKRADNRHNGDLRRLGEEPRMADRQRADKYAVSELLLARCGTV